MKLSKLGHNDFLLNQCETRIGGGLEGRGLKARGRRTDREEEGREGGWDTGTVRWWRDGGDNLRQQTDYHAFFLHCR